MGQPTRASASTLAAAFGLLLALLSLDGVAEPFIAPGDLNLRDDVQLLADSGIVRTPLTTWPLGWGAIAEAALATPVTDAMRPNERAALLRVQARARQATRSGVERSARLSAQERPRLLRSFEYTPREEGELQGGWAWLGSRFAAKLTATAVTSPEDDKTVRMDGSYGAMVVGNWMLSVGQLDRWWGPGWNGSLILGTNARPIPAFALDRNYAEPFKVPFLRLFGPWSLSVMLGQQEEDRAVPNPLFFGLRTSFKPTPYLEVGVSRTAQFCGEGRRCSVSAFFDLLLGRDNRGDDLTAEEEPGNQLAGVDFRWSLGRYDLPVAVYGQLIGDDEANGLPSRFIGMIGGEWWGQIGKRSVRTYFELTDTRSGVLDNPVPDFAYRASVFPDGYRRFDRVIGHPADNDSLVYTAGAVVQGKDQYRWTALAQTAQLNRVGMFPNPVAAGDSDYVNLEVGHDRPLLGGTLQISVGYERFSPVAGESDSGVKGFAQWIWRR